MARHMVATNSSADIEGRQPPRLAMRAAIAATGYRASHISVSKLAAHSVSDTGRANMMPRHNNAETGATRGVGEILPIGLSAAGPTLRDGMDIIKSNYRLGAIPRPGGYGGVIRRGDGSIRGGVPVTTVPAYRKWPTIPKGCGRSLARRGIASSILSPTGASSRRISRARPWSRPCELSMPSHRPGDPKSGSRQITDKMFAAPQRLAHAFHVEGVLPFR